jgi:hypothetical protein
MAHGNTLKEEVPTHRQRDPKRHDRAKGSTHRRRIALRYASVNDSSWM